MTHSAVRLPSLMTGSLMRFQISCTLRHSQDIWERSYSMENKHWNKNKSTLYQKGNFQLCAALQIEIQLSCCKYGLFIESKKFTQIFIILQCNLQMTPSVDSSIHPLTLHCQELIILRSNTKCVMSLPSTPCTTEQGSGSEKHESKQSHGSGYC